MSGYEGCEQDLKKKPKHYTGTTDPCKSCAACKFFIYTNWYGPKCTCFGFDFNVRKQEWKDHVCNNFGLNEKASGASFPEECKP